MTLEDKEYVCWLFAVSGAFINELMQVMNWDGSDWRMW